MTTPDSAAPGVAQQDIASLRIPELKKIAADLGLKGLSGMRKADLVSAITERSERGVPPKNAAALKNATGPKDRPAKGGDAKADNAEGGAKRPEKDDAAPRGERPAEEKAGERRGEGGRPEGEKRPERDAEDDAKDQNRGEDDGRGREGGRESGRYESRAAARRARRQRLRQHQGEDSGREGGNDDGSENGSGEGEERGRGGRDGGNNNSNDEKRGHRGSRGGRGRGRGRDKSGKNRDNNNGNNGNNNGGGEQRGKDNDKGKDHGNGGGDLQAVAGILDVVDKNIAFVRTTGYHAAPADVFVGQQLIKRFDLRKGDAITGQVKVGGGGNHGQGRRHGRNKQKYNNLVRVDTVNGKTVDEIKGRPKFGNLTPLYPNQRLRLETTPKLITTRVIDLIMPIGKGQRALIVSPPKAGKTTMLKNVANAIATNNPECYLMVVLVDERPEEVTDMERSIDGEVIASTFDRPPSEHAAVAELAIERAKRLVEQGQDVVVLLDSITRLGRAYNNSSPASGRILSGGVDSNALYPPKRFLGAARNIENGGSLSIIATAMVETGSAGDTVIFEEFKGTGNAELKLDRRISERRVFPAVDVGPSGTRKDELLLAPEEARIVHQLRRKLAAVDNQQAIELLIRQLKKTKSNGEFLMQIVSSGAILQGEDEEEYS